MLTALSREKFRVHMLIFSRVSQFSKYICVVQLYFFLIGMTFESFCDTPMRDFSDSLLSLSREISIVPLQTYDTLALTPTHCESLIFTQKKRFIYSFIQGYIAATGCINHLTNTCVVHLSTPVGGFFWQNIALFLRR